jgi:translation initiation factor 2 subunit 3
LLKSIIEYFPSNSNLNGNNNNNLIGQISRSFDINKSNQSYEKIKGGVLGGSIILGSLSLDSEIEIRPGRVVKNKNGLLCKPLITKVMSIKSEKISIEKAFPGCLIGIGTLIDPYCCKGDELVGNVFGLKGNMPNVYYPDITINFKICKELGYDWKISKNDKVNFQIGTLTIRNCNLKNIIKNKKNNKIAVFTLSQPCCFDENNNIIISKKTLDGIKVIIGYGNMTSGDIVNLT